MTVADERYLDVDKCNPQSIIERPNIINPPSERMIASLRSKLMQDAGRELVGRRVFVIEDESMVSMLLDELLSDIGCEVVGTASRFDEALQKAKSVAFDVAILDVNLNGRHTMPIAEEFARCGIRFVLATGYALPALPEALQKVPILEKPFHQPELVRALRTALSQGG
jgi:CheY-like chemotaxis protein